MARLNELLKIVKSLSQQEKAELIAFLSSARLHLLTAKVVSILSNKRLLALIVNYAKKSYKAKGQILNGFVFTTENKVLCKNVPVRNPIPTRTNFVA